MKRQTLFIIGLLVAMTVASCSKSFETADASEPVGEETVRPIELSRQYLSLDPSAPINYIHIVSGNGGYCIVYPERLTLAFLKLV